jgi:hypothetical protein
VRAVAGWALVAVVLVGACRRPESGHVLCRDAVRARTASAVSLCSSAYADSGNARDGAWLARALADSGAPLEEVRALAARHGDSADGAEAWNAVGDRLREADDRTGAIAAYHRAYTHRARDDHRGRVRDAQGLFQQHAANDDYRSALEYAGIAYAQSQLVPDPLVRGYVLTGIAGVLYELGDVPAVSALVDEAARVVDDKSPFYVHRRHLEAIIHVEREQFQLARQALTEVARLAPAQNLTGLERYAKLALVANELAGRNPTAAAHLLATLQLPPATSDDERIHEAYVRAQVRAAEGDHAAVLALLDGVSAVAPAAWLGRLDALRGRTLVHLRRGAEAETALRRSIDHIERVRDELGLDAMKPWLLRDWRHAFEDLFVLYVEQGRPYDAFAVVQRATARSLLDGLVDRDRGDKPALDQALDDAAMRIEGVRRLAHSLRSSPAAATPDARTVLSALGDRHTITFFTTPDATFRIFTKPGAAPRIDRLDRTALRRDADALLVNIDDRQAAAALGAAVVPTTLLPAAGVPLFIAAEEPLHHVAFAALRVDGDFLVRRHPIAMIPSAAVLVRLATSPTITGAPIVIGDATSDLGEARREAIEVARVLGTTPLVDRAAKLAPGTRASVIHIATHARATPLGAALVLADGMLTSGDVVDDRISADLVVLSSCASADPLDRDELGPLAYAFLATGARAVVGTRWSVEDTIARRFAGYFYASGGATEPVRATAAAQRRLIDDHVPTAAWAMFVVLGEH